MLTYGQVVQVGVGQPILMRAPLNGCVRVALRQMRRRTFDNLETLPNGAAAAVTSAAAATKDVEAVMRTDASAKGHDEGRHGPASHDLGSLPYSLIRTYGDLRMRLLVNRGLIRLYCICKVHEFRQ